MMLRILLFFNLGRVTWTGAYIMSRQNCCAGSRIYVQQGVYEAFLEKFATRAKKNVLGDPFDQQTFLGPQISKGQHTKIMGMIDEAKAQGATLVTGGTSPRGWFIEPTIFRDVGQDMEIMREEVFGPVAAVAPFEDAADALRKVNDTRYGLAAGVFTSDMKKGIRMAKDIEAGTVWVNGYNMLTHQMGFGGYKDSGIGKDLGEDVLGEFTNTKAVRIKL